MTPVDAATFDSLPPLPRAPDDDDDDLGRVDGVNNTDDDNKYVSLDVLNAGIDLRTLSPSKPST